MTDITRIKPGARMSQAIIAAGVVYMAGQVALDAPGASVADQTKAILANIDALLTESGTDKTRLINASIWLSDIATFDEMNKVWDAWLAEGCAPARACVESRLAAPQFTVEIQVQAALP